jgi:light-regulated signal transduction histidine kinase (bacteriophytochrome)
MRRIDVDLNVMGRSVAAEISRLEPSRDVCLVIAPDLIATGDRDLLRLVLENLLGNDWKYTSKHDSARIEFGDTHRDDATVYYFRDDVAGFDMAHRDRLFGGFQRLYRESEFAGTGVGLATVQRVIHRMAERSGPKARSRKAQRSSARCEGARGGPEPTRGVNLSSF